MIHIDMPMPKNCLECPVCNEYLCCAIPVGGHGWGENNVSDFSKSRPEWCPMKEQDAVEPFHRCIGGAHTLIEDSGFNYCPYCGRRIVDTEGR